MIVVYLFSLLVAQPGEEALPEAVLRPVTNLKAKDSPNDAGRSIDLWWEPSPDSASIVRYEIFRAQNPEGPFESVVGFVSPIENGRIKLGGAIDPFYYADNDSTKIANKVDYYYRVDVMDAQGTRASSLIAGPVQARAQWFNSARLIVLIVAVVYGGLVIIYIEFAKRGRSMFVRRIAGLDAIDDAVGRSTEMGKPILFTFGIGYLTDLATLAALSILRRIAKRAAEYETRLIVPNYDPIVMTAAQETVKQAYAEAGRPDLYNEGDITFLTSDQFGYAAGVDGIMIREKPGTVFLQGVFYAESLILAETGHSVGAIQIAGTSEPTQLPFFVAACDYTLLGEELYAASAYIDRDPQLMGSLKSEDHAKLATILILVAGAILGTAGVVIASLNVPLGDKLLEIFDKFVGIFTTS